MEVMGRFELPNDGFADRHGLRIAVDGDCLVVRADIHAESIAHDGFRGDKQGIPGSDGPAHMVGQAAVGIGNIGAALDEDNLCGLV